MIDWRARMQRQLIRRGLHKRKPQYFQYLWFLFLGSFMLFLVPQFPRLRSNNYARPKRNIITITFLTPNWLALWFCGSGLWAMGSGLWALWLAAALIPWPSHRNCQTWTLPFFQYLTPLCVAVAVAFFLYLLCVIFLLRDFLCEGCALRQLWKKR